MADPKCPICEEDMKAYSIFKDADGKVVFTTWACAPCNISIKIGD